MTKASTKSARGSGLNAQWPPATTRGSAPSRPADRTGTPARSSRLSTFVNTSSAERLKASTWNARAGRWPSTENSGTPAARIAASMSTHGA